MPEPGIPSGSLGMHHRCVGPSSDGGRATKFRPALVLLLEAYGYAEQTGGDRWEFAVEIRHLCEFGLSHNDLRWLVRTQFVEHAREVTAPEDDGREFRPTRALTFTDRTCFVLTSAGVVAARESSGTRSDDGASHPIVIPMSEGTAAVTESTVPTWDAERRVLRIDGQIVRRFKWRAKNQEAVLAAFEEEGWPVRIDDPLPPEPDQDSRRRLSDTIKCLNRKQDNQLIHFRGDGAGQGVTWELVERNDCGGQAE